GRGGDSGPNARRMLKPKRADRREQHRRADIGTKDGGARAARLPDGSRARAKADLAVGTTVRAEGHAVVDAAVEPFEHRAGKAATGQPLGLRDGVKPSPVTEASLRVLRRATPEPCHSGPPISVVARRPDL